MKRWTKARMVPHWRIAAAFAIIFLAALMPSSAGLENATYGQGLSLTVYLDNTGKALVTGYAENVSGLEFLNTSQFRFENDTHQLYALSDGLTTKVGDLWTLRFDAQGSFDDYHVTFYLPSDIRMGMINTSKGLGYLLSTSNESLVADIQGYEVSNPAISIQYQQPLAAASGVSERVPLGFSGSNANIIVLLIAALLVTALALAIVILRRRSEPLGNTSPTTAIKIKEIKVAESEAYEPPTTTNGTKETRNSSTDSREALSPQNQSMASIPQPEDDGVYLPEASPASGLGDRPGDIEPSSSQSREYQIQSEREPDQISPSGTPEASAGADGSDRYVSKENFTAKNEIVISSEMEAVMQTLTAREQAVMTTLIDHGGRMTQAEIRYETRTPKSSLTGILISLERRKLITKKEWGRTNIIELSPWFLSKKERS
jgi:uncharacterized membrane protein